LFPLLLESSNDAALALDHATKGGLVRALDTVAKKYGADHAHFSDASGLSASNTTTARDLMNFSRAVGEKYPFVYDISELPQYIGEYTGWLNNNPVFNTDSYRGGKHGYTPAAGRTLVAQFLEHFTAGDRTIGYIILGSDNLAIDVATLRSYVSESVHFE
jgi:D-alanyl-D-alanine carboxypeptidase